MRSVLGRKKVRDAYQVVLVSSRQAFDGAAIRCQRGISRNTSEASGWDNILASLQNEWNFESVRCGQHVRRFVRLLNAILWNVCRATKRHAFTMWPVFGFSESFLLPWPGPLSAFLSAKQCLIYMNKSNKCGMRKGRLCFISDYYRAWANNETRGALLLLLYIDQPLTTEQTLVGTPNHQVVWFAQIWRPLTRTRSMPDVASRSTQQSHWMADSYKPRFHCSRSELVVIVSGKDLGDIMASFNALPTELLIIIFRAVASTKTAVLLSGVNRKSRGIWLTFHDIIIRSIFPRNFPMQEDALESAITLAMEEARFLPPSQTGPLAPTVAQWVSHFQRNAELANNEWHVRFPERSVPFYLMRRIKLAWDVATLPPKKRSRLGPIWTNAFLTSKQIKDYYNGELSPGVMNVLDSILMPPSLRAQIDRAPYSVLLRSELLLNLQLPDFVQQLDESSPYPSIKPGWHYASHVIRRTMDDWAETMHFYRDVPNEWDDLLHLTEE
nr:hypothetical protein CFP56_25786 [Quercus suber]